MSKLFTFEEITQKLDAVAAEKPFEHIMFGHTQNGVSVLYDGANYDGMHGGFIYCAEPLVMASRLNAWALAAYPHARPANVSTPA